MSHSQNNQDRASGNRAPDQERVAVGLHRVVRPACQASFKGGIKCRVSATCAVVENGDYVPVCEYHANVARHVGWEIGTLRPNAKLTDPHD